MPLFLRLGFFLAIRQLRRTSPWTTLLIVFIMTLTFFNLVVVSGILVGLIEGSSNAYRAEYSADVLVTPLDKYDHIQESRRIIDTAKAIPGVIDVSARYLAGVEIEANYEDGRTFDEGADSVAIQLAGINPSDEQRVTALFDKLLEGRALEEGDQGVIVLGKGNLQRYTRGIPGLDTIDGVEIGSKVLLTAPGISREYTVIGIVGSKIEAVDFRAFIPESEFRSMFSRTAFDADEIAIDLDENTEAETVQDQMRRTGLQAFGDIQTWEESQGTFFQDIKTTFGMLGSIFGAVGLLVASITVFIVIFINAVTRQRYIGILKALGVEGRAIIASYVIQSLFYGIVGSAIGFILVYTAIQPYIAANPIDFPFSDGILSAPLGGTLIRAALLLFATVIAGYIPAFMIVRRPALKSLLGR